MTRIDARMSEAYILGAVLQDYAVMDELMPTLAAEMFADEHHARMWMRMCELHSKGEPVDVAAVSLADPMLVQDMGVDRLLDMQRMYVGRADLQWHVEKLCEAYARRQLLQGLARVQEMALDVTGVTLDELRDHLEQMTLVVAQTAVTTASRSGLEATMQWLDEVEAKFKDPKRAYGIMTGWSDLDALTLGWHRQDLIVVGGRTSVGKTAFAIETIIRAVKHGYKVAVWSLEMSANQIRDRIAANLTGVHLARMRTGQFGDINTLHQVAETMDFIARINIMDERGVTADRIAAEMKRVKRTEGLDLAVVDYIQEIVEPPQPNDNAGSAYGRVARKLRKAAQACDCSVLALSQLARTAHGKKPTVADLSGSSGIESAADLVILLHRDIEQDPNVLYVDLAKQRNGPTGELRLYYDRARQRIENLA